MKAFLLALFLALICIQTASSQTFTKLFKPKHGQIGHQAIALDNGGALMCFGTGSWGDPASVLKLDANGDTVWFNQYMYNGNYGGYQINLLAERTDGKFVYGGSVRHNGSYKAFFALADSNGVISDTLGLEKNRMAVGLQEMTVASDNSIYFVGSHRDFFSGGVSFYSWTTPVVGKISSQLSLTWVRKYGSHTSTNKQRGVAKAITVASDGNPVFYGYRNRRSGTTGYLYIAKMNPSGSSLWRKELLNFYSEPTGVCAAPDGSIYALRRESNLINANSDNDFVIEKFDAYGNTIWSKAYGTNQNEYAENILFTSGGALVVTGRLIDSNNDQDGFLVHVDTAGTIDWSRSYGHPFVNENYNYVDQKSDGNFILSGNASPYGGIISQTSPNGYVSCNLDTLAFSSNSLSSSYANGISTTSEGLSVITTNYSSVVSDTLLTDSILCFAVQSCNTIAGLSIKSSILCESEIQEFKNSSVGANAYDWFVDSIKVSSSSNFDRTFAPGNHDVRLIAKFYTCADTIDTSFTVNAFPRDTLFRTICYTDSFTIGSKNFNQSGFYSDTIVAAASNGCDSIISLSLNVTNLVDTSLYDSLCQGESISFLGRILHSTGTYRDTLQSSKSCDSLVELQLLVKPVYETVFTDSICEGSSFSWRSQNILSTGIYYDTIQAANQCDSVLRLDFKINPVYWDTLHENICNGQSYDFDGFTLTQTGMYPRTYSLDTDCDSNVTLYLNVSNPDATIRKSGASLVAKEGYTYSWFYCASSNVIGGESDSIFSPIENGGYGVVVTDSMGCKDTSLCLTVNNVGMNSRLNQSSVQLFPNPAQHQVFLSGDLSELESVQWFTIHGQAVSVRITELSNEIKTPENAGHFQLLLNFSDHSEFRRVVVQP